MIITDEQPKLHHTNHFDISISTYQIPESSATQYGHRDNRRERLG